MRVAAESGAKGPICSGLTWAKPTKPEEAPVSERASRDSFLRPFEWKSLPEQLPAGDIKGIRKISAGPTRWRKERSRLGKPLSGSVLKLGRYLGSDSFSARCNTICKCGKIVRVMSVGQQRKKSRCCCPVPPSGRKILAKAPGRDYATDPAGDSLRPEPGTDHAGGARCRRSRTGKTSSSRSITIPS